MKKFLLTILLVVAMGGMAFGGEITLSGAVYTDDGSEIADISLMDPGREVEFTFTIADFPLPLYYQATISTVGGVYSSFGATRNHLNPISISKSGGFSPGDSGTVSLRIYDRLGGTLLEEATEHIAVTGEPPRPDPNPDPAPESHSGDSSGGGCNSGFATVTLLAALMNRKRK